MKGAYSSPEELGETVLAAKLYGDSCYGYDSGGAPDAIPDLSYEDFVAAHAKFYHPTNAYFFIDGSVNLEEILNRQDRIELTELTLLGMDKVNAYISLLFLTVDSDYDLMQDEFYGEQYVVRHVTSESQEIEDEDNIFDAVNNVTSILKEEGVDSNGTIEIQN